MKEKLKNTLTGPITLITLFLLLGFSMIIKAEEMIHIISYTLGLLILSVAIYNFYKFFKSRKEEKKKILNLVIAILGIVLAIFIVIKPEAIATVVPFVFGLWLVINTMNKIPNLLLLLKEKNYLATYYVIIMIIMAIMGLILIFNPFTSSVLIIRIIGLFIVIDAILELILLFLVPKNKPKIEIETKEEHRIIESKENNEPEADQ